MRKNKLYTVNKWNRPAFMPDRESNNIFDGFTFGQSSQMNNSPFGVSLTPPTQIGPYNSWMSPLQKAQASSQIQGLSFNQQLSNFAPRENAVSNPFSFKDAFSAEGLKNGLKAGAGAAIGGVANMVGGLAGSAISGGLSSGAGNAIGSIGSTVGSAVSAVNPILGGAISIGSSLVGGLTNRMFGTKVDQAKLNAANQGTDAYNSFQSNASSFDDVTGPIAQANVQNAYSGGWFSSGKARRKNEELKRQRREARQLAFRAVDNNINNLVDDQMNDALANYSAFGGLLDMMDNNNDMGAINYGFMQDYLTQKKRDSEAKNKLAGITPMPAFMPNAFALGGDVQMNGGDFTTGLAHINAGGSHEMNPYEGVQVGIDNNGTPNLVEEGEVIYNDYVYSARIPVDRETKEKFHLPKKKEITYADLAKKLEKEIAERPNDPISQRGFEAQMQDLADEQERQKQQMEAERAKAAFEALSPEEQTAVMQEMSARENLAARTAGGQEAMQRPDQEGMLLTQQQQPVMGDGSEANLGYMPTEEQIANVTALGGNLVKNCDVEPEANVFAAGGRAARKAIKKYSKEWFLSQAKALGIVGDDATDIKGFTFSDTDPAANLQNFNTLYKKYQYDKALDAYKKGKRQSKRNELFGDKGLYRYSDDGTHIMKAQLDENGDKVLDDSGKVKWDVYDGDEDSILDAFDYGEGFSWDDKNTQTLQYPVESIERPEWLRYAGLFGPAAGLGLMAAGVGKPDTASIDAAIEGAGDVSLAGYKPLGNYLTYRPMDIWFEQNRQNANARATDRAIMNASNGNSGAAMAGLLASGYNDQIASGNLYRQALEYNDNLRKQVGEFNKDTDKWNSDQYGRTSQFNASARNQARQQAASLRLNAAAQKADMDAGWYNSLYGNISGLFKGIGDLGTENYRMNRIGEMAARGDFGVATPDTPGFGDYLKWLKSQQGKSKSKGGKLKRRGLTF